MHTYVAVHGKHTGGPGANMAAAGAALAVAAAGMRIPPSKYTT